jgi:hypothetical protein
MPFRATTKIVQGDAGDANKARRRKEQANATDRFMRLVYSRSAPSRRTKLGKRAAFLQVPRRRDILLNRYIFTPLARGGESDVNRTSARN